MRGELKKQRRKLNIVLDTVRTALATNLKNAITNLDQGPRLNACLLITEGLICIADAMARFLRPELRLRFNLGSVREAKFFDQVI